MLVKEGATIMPDLAKNSVHAQWGKGVLRNETRYTSFDPEIRSSLEPMRVSRESIKGRKSDQEFIAFREAIRIYGPKKR